MSLKDFEHPQILNEHPMLDRGPYPDDWRKWPDMYRQASEIAVQKTLDEFPGAKIVMDRSVCLRRSDLSGIPWMLYRQITLEVP